MIYYYNDWIRRIKILGVVVVVEVVPNPVKLCRAKVTKFLKSDENFARGIITPDENFARQSFAHQYNHILSK